MEVIQDKKLLSMWESDYYLAIDHGLCENRGQPLAILVCDEYTSQVLKGGLYLRCTAGLVKTPLHDIHEGDDLTEAYYKASPYGKWEVMEYVQ